MYSRISHAFYLFVATSLGLGASIGYGDSLVCAIKDAKKPERFKSVKVDLQQETLEEAYSTTGSLDIGKKLSFSFDIALEIQKRGAKGQTISLSAFFYENKMVQDEIESQTWSFETAKVKRGKPVISEPLVYDDKKVADFVCYYNAKRKSEALSDVEVRIEFQDENGKQSKVAIDKDGEPRLNGEKKTYPTIKDFRKDGDSSKVCYVGSAAGVTELLTLLVDAANGDGDSFAELNHLTMNKSSNEFIVIVTITDESGENEETYTFPPCKKQV